MKNKLLISLFILALTTSVFAKKNQTLEFSGFIEDLPSFADEMGNEVPFQHILNTDLNIDASQVKSFEYVRKNSNSVNIKGYFYTKNGTPIFKVTSIEQETPSIE